MITIPNLKTGRLVKTKTGYEMFDGESLVGKIGTSRTYVAALVIGSRRFMFGRADLIGKGDSAVYINLISSGRHEDTVRCVYPEYKRIFELNKETGSYNCKVIDRAGKTIGESFESKLNLSTAILFVV